MTIAVSCLNHSGSSCHEKLSLLNNDTGTVLLLTTKDNRPEMKKGNE
jgi:hypothetical protein